MPSAQGLQNNAVVNAIGVVTFGGTGGTSIKKVPAKGHVHFTLTTKKANAGTATIILKGTNNPDPADTNGKTLITNTHAGSDQQDANAADEGWEYVFVDVQTFAAGSFAVGNVRLHMTGFAGAK